jgi:uncharacterized protein YaaN involved in tellurite resistance
MAEKLNNTPINTTVDDEELTPEELIEVEALAKEININDDDYVSTYGSKAQAEIARFSREALGNTRIYEIGDESQILFKKFKNHLTDFKSIDEPSLISGIFAKFIGQVKWWIQKLDKVANFIKETDQQFRKQITELSVDKKINEKAQDVNIRNRRALIVHIRAGKLALQCAREGKLVELQNKANETQARSNVEAARDFSKKCDEFELKLGRLDSSLAITYIRKSEIDLLLDSQRRSISLFEDLISQAIPLWLDGMRTSLNIKHVEQANVIADAGREMTEDLFMSNIERLGNAAEGTIKNVDSGIIRTSVIIEGTNKLLTKLEAVDAACREAVNNSRRYEQERAENSKRITEYQAKSIS